MQVRWTYADEFLDEFWACVESRKADSTLWPSAVLCEEVVEQGLIAECKRSCVRHVVGDVEAPYLLASALVKMLIRKLIAVELMHGELIDGCKSEHEAMKRRRRQMCETTVQTQVLDFHSRCDCGDLSDLVFGYRIAGRVE